MYVAIYVCRAINVELYLVSYMLSCKLSYMLSYVCISTCMQSHMYVYVYVRVYVYVLIHLNNFEYISSNSRALPRAPSLPGVEAEVNRTEYRQTDNNISNDITNNNNNSKYAGM